MSHINFENVSKKYGEMTTALKGITFRVEPGEFVALAGPSGSGKTTILNLAAGFDTPSSGDVRLLDQDLKNLSRKQLLDLRRQHLGYIFQSYNLFPVLTAIENVEYPLALNHRHARERRQIALEALREVGLEKMAHRFPSELSGGQQQRVAIARALATHPHIVFADEPTANLDSHTAHKLLELFCRLNDDTKITFVFSSHDPSVLTMAKRILRISDGEIKEDCSRS